MSIANDSGRISWLAAAWGAQKAKVMSLLGRLGDLGSREDMKPNVFAKFLHILGQIANERDKEVDILSEIEAIERKHRIQREHGALKRVEAEPADTMNRECEDEWDEECERPGLGWDWLLTMKEAKANQDTGSGGDDWPAGGGKQSHGLLWLILAAYLMARGLSAKKPRLTAD